MPEFHSLAAIDPMIEGTDFTALVEDGDGQARRIDSSAQPPKTLTDRAAKANNTLTPDPMVVALTQVFAASLTTAVKFGGADYAAAAAIAIKVVQEAISTAIEGRAS